MPDPGRGELLGAFRVRTPRETSALRRMYTAYCCGRQLALPIAHAVGPQAPWPPALVGQPQGRTRQLRKVWSGSTRTTDDDNSNHDTHTLQELNRSGNRAVHRLKFRFNWVANVLPPPLIGILLCSELTQKFRYAYGRLYMFRSWLSVQIRGLRQWLTSSFDGRGFPFNRPSPRAILVPIIDLPE